MTVPAPNTRWLLELADWVQQSPTNEAQDIARDLVAHAARLTVAFERGGSAELPSPRWVAQLAEWISQDARPQAGEFGRQVDEWARLLAGDRL